MQISFSPSYCDTEIAFDTTRKAAAIAASLVDDPIDAVTVREPVPITRDELLVVHDAAYVDAVLTGSPRTLAETNEIGWDVGFAAAVCASTGGVRDAALRAMRDRTVAGSLSSGLHHANAGRGRGYCTFNGLVIAAHAARAHGARRVLILDLDAHCGGGSASLIDGLVGVEQVDVAVDDYDRYASRTDARLTVAAGSEYLEVVARELDMIPDPSSISLVLYNAGMDPHRHAGGDPDIDDTVLMERELLVFGWAATHALPMAWVLAGGYTDGAEGAELDMAGLVRLHRMTIEVAAGVTRAGS